jgi:alanine racemase
MTNASKAHTNEEEALRRPSSHSWVEIDLGCIRHNVRAIRQFIGAERHLWAVVKANAYGHSAVPTAMAALEAGADGLAVSCLNEAAELRVDAGIRAPLLILAPGEPRAAAWIVRLDILQTACYEDMVQALSRAAQRLEKPARVHLKVDTGMGRLGVRPETAAGFAQLIVSQPGLRLEGVFSHLAAAEAEDPSYAYLQFERYRQAVREIEAAGIPTGMKHLANSAATLRFPEMLLDGVRAGLLIYGITPQAPGLAPLDLRPALSWKTRVGFLHKLPAGCAVSYGCTYVTPRDSLVAVVPVGYADGYPRQASNRSHVLLNGHLCPVIGVVCMDHMMVDATPAGDPHVDDEVVLLGRQGNLAITANHLAEWANTVAHEVPTVIGRRVKRVYLDREQPLDPGPGSKG